MKISVVSGGFDPVHSGHIKYLNAAKGYGEILIVLLNSDEWLRRKKNKSFMQFSERKIILENLVMVDEVMGFKDDMLGSCSNGLEQIKKMFPKSEIFFCNGGDRDNTNIPELNVRDINFVFGVGGDFKSNSSSWILKDFKYDKEDRVWGKFYNLFKDSEVKLKELIIDPNNGMSYQRHFQRNEFWFVSNGSCLVKHSEDDPNNFEYIKLKKDDIFHVKSGSWHQIINEGKEECRIIEIQYGEKTEEDDIERLHLFKEGKA
ncbi:MAG: adenylyltransferase/cytidyltransferase family protein [Pseudomonadota bacterium]|nr:adenylyltransferase/cytidyltransferase family protein [Pseudomonadota bacterium]